MKEISKLHDLLTEAGIPHTFLPLHDGWQIRVYADNTFTNELDDVIFHSGSHGYELGLLETYFLHECCGFETAEQVFEGWKKMFEDSQNRG